MNASKILALHSARAVESSEGAPPVIQERGYQINIQINNYRSLRSLVILFLGLLLRRAWQRFKNENARCKRTIIDLR